MEFDRPGFDKEVGLRLQLARKRRGITQVELATHIGLPRASYANLESGRQRIPTDILWRAAVVLNVSIATLVPEPRNRRPTDKSIFPSVTHLFGDAALDSPSQTDESFITYGTATTFPVLSSLQRKRDLESDS